MLPTGFFQNLNHFPSTRELGSPPPNSRVLGTRRAAPRDLRFCRILTIFRARVSRRPGASAGVRSERLSNGTRPPPPCARTEPCRPLSFPNDTRPRRPRAKTGPCRPPWSRGSARSRRSDAPGSATDRVNPEIAARRPRSNRPCSPTQSTGASQKGMEQGTGFSFRRHRGCERGAGDGGTKNPSPVPS